MSNEIKTMRSNSKEFKELIKYDKTSDLSIEGQAILFLSNGIKKNISKCKPDKIKFVMGKYINLVYTYYPERMIKHAIQMINSITINIIINKLNKFKC